MNHTESHIQQACVRAFRYQHPQLARLLIAIPNGGARSAKTGALLKAEGVVAGAPDLFLFVPSNGYHGLAIEMKTAKGRQQDTQKAMQRHLEAQGYKYIVCRSFGAFQQEITDYLTHKFQTG